MTSSNLWYKASRRLVPVLAAVSLASCGSSSGTAPGGDVLRAGLWELTESVDSIEGPNIRPQAIEGLKAQWAIPTHSACLRSDQVAKPPIEFFSEAPGDCSYERFSMRHGKIDATINCPRPDGWHVVEIAGTAKPDGPP